jgi:hypothetical protein
MINQECSIILVLVRGKEVSRATGFHQKALLLLHLAVPGGNSAMRCAYEITWKALIDAGGRLQPEKVWQVLLELDRFHTKAKLTRNKPSQILQDQGEVHWEPVK